MMILGLGFIMVAAMFPVAIRQTQETVLETTGASVAKSGASYMNRWGNWILTPGNATANTSPFYTWNFPPTNGKVMSYGTFVQGVGSTPFTALPVTPTSGSAGGVGVANFWQTLSGNLILSTDARYAWVPFYSRSVVNNVNASNAQVTIIAVQCRNTSTFTNYDLEPIVSGATTMPPNLQGRQLLATFTDNRAASPPTPDTVQFYADGAGSGPTGLTFSAPYAPSTFVGAIAEGTFVIVADDTTVNNTSARPFSCDGYVYRVGNPALNASGTPTGAWELMPSNDLRTSPSLLVGGVSTLVEPVGTATTTVRVFVVGRGYNNPANGDTTFAGPAMDIEAFSTFIKVQ